MGPLDAAAKSRHEVYAYRIDAADSHYKLVFGTAYQHDKPWPRWKACCISMVRLWTLSASRISRGHRTQFPRAPGLDGPQYSSQDVGGKRYVLPLHAEIRLSRDNPHAQYGRSTATASSKANRRLRLAIRSPHRRGRSNTDRADSPTGTGGAIEYCFRSGRVREALDLVIFNGQSPRLAR